MLGTFKTFLSVVLQWASSIALKLKTSSPIEAGMLLDHLNSSPASLDRMVRVCFKQTISFVGKSNLMDAISFVLAIPAKYLRSQNLQELIYNNENDELNASTCNVSLFYITDEVDHENNEKVNPGEEIEFFRRVNANGSSQYKINGKQVTNEDYIRKLASFNILVSCRNFLVYQGDVQNISTRSPEEMTLLFEQISGSYDLRSEYETLREKREQLKSVTDMILKKKYTMMSERRVVEDQKKEATEFQKKLDLLRDLRVEYFLWQLFNIESNLEDHARKVKSLKTKAEQLEESDQVMDNE